MSFQPRPDLPRAACAPPPGIGLEVVLVTPQLAEEWLAFNAFNRPIQRQVVERYAQDMREGRWRVNGESVKFGRSGALIDGQHRLRAVAEAGRPVELTVLRGLDESVFNTLDSGRTRRASDVLGILQESHRTTLTAALRNLWCHRQGRSFATQVSTTVLLELLEREPGLRDSVAWVAGRRWEPNLAPLGVLAFCLHVFRELGPDHAQTFFEQFHSGSGIVRGDPVLTLRRRLFEAQGRLDKQERIALLFRAWNAHVEGQKLHLLRLPRDEQGHLVVPTLSAPRRTA